MKEQKSILEAYSKVDLSKRKVVLATVVKVRGSSYRSPGARMLITDDGTWVGSISGGCLEGDALRKARQVMHDGKAITVTYDTREESNQNLGIGLGCNGVIDVLLEPIDVSKPDNAISIFRTLVETREPIAMATVFSSSQMTGEKLLLNSRGKFSADKFDGALRKTVEQDLQNIFSQKKSFTKKYLYGNETIEIFLELIQPSVSVIIFGGGFDARPVSQLAKSLGWNVSVTDECVAHIAPIFFPSADKLSLCQRDFVDRDFDITPYTACVLMSHNYEYDRDVLRTLLKTETPYIGILGPRKRFDKMLIEFAEEGVEVLPEDFHRIHSPIGLDIGAETPDEIAISIISEIQGKFTNRSGGFLKYRDAPIHQRDLNSDQVFKQVYISDSIKTKLASD
jgi:xanthine dehydrogenase accessory factor